MTKPNKQIREGAKEVRSLMIIHLEEIAQSITKQIMINVRKLPKAKQLNATKDIKPKGLNEYKRDLKSTLAVISLDALDLARKEVPKASKVKLMENEERLLFGEFEKLPPDIRKKIEASNNKIIGTQVADLEKNLFFTFDAATRRELGLSEIEFELNESSGAFVSGNAVRAASHVSSANMVNDVRNAFFTDKEVLEEIEAFQFMNPSPVAPICVDLAGLIFAKDDPNHFKYTPPLHFSCESWIRPIIKLSKNQSIEGFKPSTKKIEDTIQFAINNHGACCNCGNHY